jgi:hypothetical protein
VTRTSGFKSKHGVRLSATSMTVTVTASGTPLSVPRAPLMTRAVTSRPGCTVVQLLQLAGSVHWPGPTAAGDRLGLSDIPSHWQASKTSGLNFELELGPGRGHPNGSHMMLSDTVTANDRASDITSESSKPQMCAAVV